MIVVRLILESFRFAWNALKMNLLRTTLSLLGVTIGIFAIISVFTIVDSLEKNIKDSLSFLGSGVIYVGKWPYTADAKGEYNWWDFWNRPNPSNREYKFLDDKLKSASSVAIFAKANTTLKRKSNSISDVGLNGGSYNYAELFDLNIEGGRYFNRKEIETGRNVAIIGSNVAKSLFPNEEDPIGQEKHEICSYWPFEERGGEFFGFREQG